MVKHETYINNSIQFKTNHADITTYNNQIFFNLLLYSWYFDSAYGYKTEISLAESQLCLMASLWQHLT